jgi:predicted unusual protein kinase regulating ubiquinone biosynthesis (AarF/ABC1/UbiB family)
VAGSREQTSALQRALRMAAMSAGVAGSYAGYLAQRAFLGEEKREEKLKASHTKAGKRLTGELSALRGPVMKLGQLLSLQTDLVPEEILQEISMLQMHAPGMHPSLVRAQFKTSMGAPPEEFFRSFQAEPFAAASLGQVHHAVTREGKKVAVKIQYPGIRSAVTGDFKLLRKVTGMARLTAHVPKAVLDEGEQQILAETDYRREADNIDFFRSRLQPLGYVTVPEVFREYSSDRVLTMSLLTGEHLQTYMARRRSQQERDRLGSHLFELFYFQLLKAGAFHADPHWGNYLFGSNEAIGLVDFGCGKYLTPKFVDNLHAVFLYPGDRQSAEFRRLYIDQRTSSFARKMSPEAERAWINLADGFYRRVYPPEVEKENEPIDFGNEALLRDYMREAARLFRAKGTHPDYILFARAEFGLYQTLHRLRSRVKTSKIVRRFLRPQRV